MEKIMNSPYFRPVVWWTVTIATGAFWFVVITLIR